MHPSESDPNMIDKLIKKLHAVNQKHNYYIYLERAQAKMTQKTTRQFPEKTIINLIAFFPPEPSIGIHLFPLTGVIYTRI